MKTKDFRFNAAGVSFVAAVPVDELAELPGREIIKYATAKRVEIAVALKLAELGIVTGESFRYARKALGLLAVDLGHLLGVSDETISNWETGKHEIPRFTWACEVALVDERRRNRTTLHDMLKEKKLPIETGKDFQKARESLQLYGCPKCRAEDLAGLFGVTPTTISRWENDKNEIPQTAKAVLYVLSVEQARETKSVYGALEAASNLKRLGKSPIRVSVPSSDPTGEESTANYYAVVASSCGDRPVIHKLNANDIKGARIEAKKHLTKCLPGEGEARVYEDHPGITYIIPFDTIKA